MVFEGDREANPMAIPVLAEPGAAVAHQAVVEVTTGYPASLAVHCEHEIVAGAAVNCKAVVVDAWGNPARAAPGLGPAATRHRSVAASRNGVPSTVSRVPPSTGPSSGATALTPTRE